MNILDKILEHKRREVLTRKEKISVRMLESTPGFSRPVASVSKALRKKNGAGIIAEFKRRSPSKGIINGNADVAATTRGYADAGAAALSVLTDNEFFGGADDDLVMARDVNQCPILRKDFVIDEFQIFEARSLGADVILLIAAALTPKETKVLTQFAHSLGLEVLLEVHNAKELVENLDAGADLIGVNNRDLKQFTVSLDVSRELASLIPDHVVKVSESGLSSPADIIGLKQYGYQGFLIGENFMKTEDPGAAASEFIQQLSAMEAVGRK